MLFALSQSFRRWQRDVVPLRTFNTGISMEDLRVDVGELGLLVPLQLLEQLHLLELPPQLASSQE